MIRERTHPLATAHRKSRIYCLEQPTTAVWIILRGRHVFEGPIHRRTRAFTVRGPIWVGREANAPCNDVAKAVNQCKALSENKINQN